MYIGMKFTNVLGALGLVSVVIASRIKDSQINNNEFSTPDSKEFDALIKDLQEYNAQNFVPGYGDSSLNYGSPELSKRSQLPILDSVFVVLKNSELCYTMIDNVLLQPPLLDLVLNTTIWTIEAQLLNLTNLFIALDKSNLLLDTLVICLQDPLVLPGLIRITKDVIQESGFKLFSFSNKEKKYQETSVVEKENLRYTKRDNAVTNLLLTSLDDSGLGASLVVHILTTPQLAPAAAHIMYRLITVKALTLSLMYDALKSSNLIWNLIRKILGDPQVLLKFGTIIVEKVSQGTISTTIIEYFY